MHPLLGLVPGLGKVNLALRTLGITKEELEATDLVVRDAAKAPFLRALPQGVLPTSTTALIQMVTGIAGVTDGVPGWVVTALGVPHVRHVIATEAERYIMASPSRDHLLSAIGKIANKLMPGANLDDYPTLVEFIAEGLVPAIAEKLPSKAMSTSQVILHRCRKCGEVQAVSDEHSFSCRFCYTNYHI